jgi:hypothetical protein
MKAMDILAPGLQVPPLKRLDTRDAGWWIVVVDIRVII